MSLTLCRYTLQAVTATGALFLLGCAAPTESGRSTTPDYGVVQADEAPDAEAPRQKRPTRRMRASLSMPYFSFAQSLNPRS